MRGVQHLTCIARMIAARTVCSLIDFSRISTTDIRQSVCAKDLFPARFVESVLLARMSGGEGWARHCSLREGTAAGGFGNEEGMYVCMCVYMYVHTYLYIYIYIYIYIA